MLKPSPLKHKEDGHALLSEQAHREAHKTQALDEMKKSGRLAEPTKPEQNSENNAPDNGGSQGSQKIKKQESLTGNIFGDIAVDLTIGEDIFRFLTGVDSPEKKQEKKAKSVKHEEKHTNLGTQEKLIKKFGTSDRDKIIVDSLTNEDGSLKNKGDEFPTLRFGERDDKTYLNPNDLPMFKDKDIMDYLYSPYMTDAETIPTQISDFVGGLFGAGTDYAAPGNKRQKKVFQDRFSSNNTDRSRILDLITTKQSNYRKQKFDAKHDYKKGLDVSSQEWADVADLSGHSKEVYDLMQAGDKDKADELNNKNGFYTLYNKDGKYIEWSELSDEDKANATPENTQTKSKEDEEKAIILAERNKPVQLQTLQLENRHNLVAAVNMLRETHGEAKTSLPMSGVGNVGLFDSTDDFNAAVLSATENDSLIGGLVEAVGDDEVTRNYNEALKKFLITGRALELNQDISKLAEEGTKYDNTSVPEMAMNVKDFLSAPDEFADYTADEQVEVFSEYMKETGVAANDDWKRVTREGGDWLLPGGIEMFGEEVDIRDIAEGGRDFVKHIAPLVASLAIAKKIPLSGVTKITRGAKGIKSIKYFQGSKTLGGQVSKKFTGVGAWMKNTKLGKTAMGKRVVDIGLGGVEELVYLSLADQVGGNLFDMDPMVYNPETDDLNWEFAFGLGAGNVIGKKVISKLSNTTAGSKFLSRVSKVKTAEKAFQRGLGATAGVGSMEIAKIFSGDSELMQIVREGGELTEDQKNEMYLNTVKTAASDWVGMFALGYITPGGKVGEAMERDIQNFNIKVLNTSKAAKKLGIKENVDASEIEIAASKKKAETTKKWLKSKRTEEDANTRKKELKEIEDAASDMNGRLHIKLAKELISGDKKRLAEVERQIYVFNRKLGTGQKINGQNILDLAGMKKAEFDYFVKKMNNPMAAQALNAKRDFYVSAREYVKDFKNITNRKESVKFLEETVDYLDKLRELEALKSDKDGNNGAKIEVAKLELEPIKQKHTDKLVELNKKYKEAVNKELLVAKKIATSLGAEFEIAKDTDGYIKKGGTAGTAGYHYVENGKSKILVDPVAAAKAQTIGTGIHETVHHILKDAFKKDGKVTKEGVAIIDKFLDSLGDKDRKFLEGEIEQRDYKSKKKEDYYEEYLTTYVEGLKNKDIKLDLSKAQAIENVLLPHLNKVFPNLGKKTIKYSTKDADSLKEMLNDIFSESERLGNMSKYEVKDFMADNPVKFSEGLKAITTEPSFSKFPEMVKINKFGENYTRKQWEDGGWREVYGNKDFRNEVLKMLTKKSGEANTKFNGMIGDPRKFAEQVYNQLGGMNPGQRKVGGHIKNFDITEKVYDKEGVDFGISGWINGFADLRVLTVMKKADKILDAIETKSLDAEGVSEVVYEGPSAYDMYETNMSNANAGRIIAESSKAKIHELMFEINKGKGAQAKEIHDGIRKSFTTKEGTIDMNKLMDFASGKNMKSLPRLVLSETVGLFVPDKALAQKIANKIEKKSNLDQADIIALQKGLDRRGMVELIAEYVIPEGFITQEVKYRDKKGESKSTQVPSEATGVPNKIKAIMHEKRSIAGVTTIDGTKVRADVNFFGHYKKNITVEVLENLREAIGIMKDGTRNTSPRNIKKDGVIITEGVGETLKGVMSLTEKMFTSQGVREPMYELGKIFEPEMLAIADGKPSKSYSKVYDKTTLDKIKESYQIDPVKTGRFIEKIKEAYEDLSPAEWELYKEKNGYETISGLEDFLFIGEFNKEKLDYTRMNREGNYPGNDMARIMTNKNGRVKPEYQLIKPTENGRVITEAGKEQTREAINFIENSHPVLRTSKTLAEKLGHKGKTPDGRNLVITPAVESAKSKLTLKQEREIEKKLKDVGVNLEAIPDAIDMVKANAKIKNPLKTIFSGKGNVEQKLTEFKNKHEGNIEAINQGNSNLNMALIETSRILYGEGKISDKYFFNEGKLQTNITAGKRGLSTYGFHYVVDGKMIADKAAPSKAKLGMYDSKSKKWLPKNEKGDLYTLKDYYSNKEYREHIKDWMETAEWKERYDINIKDPKVKEGARNNDITLEQAAERLTIKNLNIGNEHILGNSKTMKESNDYVFSSGKIGSPKGIAEKHVTLWAPDYIRTEFLDKLGPLVSEKGLGRLTAYLPLGKTKNVYTYKGKKVAEHLADTKKFQEMIDKINNTQKSNITKAINSVIKNYSKLKGRDPLKDVKTISEAVKQGRKINKKPKGMSAWDFDDTLATTKSGVRARIPNVDGLPKPNRKVIFLAGGAGSGKGNVIKKLNLEKQGFKLVNSDISLEWLKKNDGLPENMNDLTKEQRSTLGKLQYQSRQVAKNKLMKYKGNAEGVVVDGTGGSIKSMEKLVNEFKEKGYDASMLFVETSLPTALARNKARAERSLLDKIVERNHEAVQGNKKGFVDMFGERFMEVKTDNLKQESAMPKDLVDKMNDFVSGYEKIRLDAEQFATDGKSILDKGGKFDFSEFNVVTKGEKGPFFQKALDRAKKFGLKDQFVLTARPPEAALPIYEFLKAQGLEIPLKNITGLGNSTGEAKALWMLEKFAEGYNDMYFADDAMQNVKAVRDVLGQLDIKSKVQQAYSKLKLNKDINDIMNHSFGIESKKVFSTAEGKVRGKDKKRRKFMMTDSASDLELLMEPMYGKGKKGIENKKWFEENFYKPWERGVNSLNTARQTILNDYMGLRKQNKDIVKSLDKPVEGTNFTTDQAARVYIWNKAGFEVPGLTKTSKAKLLEHVANNPKLQAYAESVARLTKIETGLRQPKETWWAETIATEVQQTGTTVGREKYIGEWLDVKNEIFTKENMAKMESELGPKWREATENMFDRMETGKTRNRDLGRIGNEVMNYLNGSVGAIMNLNTRSATLQLISSVNFINHAENNPLKAGLAFANQPQYWKDFMTIMNSDMLKQRRDGLKINVTEAELAAAVHGPGSKAKKALSWILKQGYIPTKIADSFAISSGGATYYRNRAKMYQKQGLSLKEAEAKAFIDFAGIAEKTQQSSRPDLLSQQQTSFEGRLLLPFANTPMQMNRIMVKEMLDIGKGRYKGAFGQDSFTNKMSKVAYYGAIQSAIFAGLQTGLFALMTNSDDDEIIANKKVKAYNTMADSFLRGMGIPGVVASGVKNAGMAFYKQNEKGFNADYSEIGEALLNMSPTIGSKFSKLDQAGNTYNYNKREILEKGFSLDNTYGIEAAATTIEALTNVPIARVLRKTENIKGALDDRNENWQRAMNGLGWSGWDVQSNVFGIEKAEKKEERSVASKARAKVKKEENKKKKEKENEAIIEKNKKKSKRDGVCSAISKGGTRCKSKAVNGGMCTVHEKATQNITGVKSQCKKIKSGGKRCGMKTSAKSGYCYYHD